MSTEITPIKNYTREYFLNVFPEFKTLFDSSDKNKYNIMFDLYCEIGKEIFDNVLFGNQNYICLSLWIAHNISLALTRTKNVNNEYNLDTQNPSSTVSNDIGGKEKHSYLAGFREDYSLTEYGKILYPTMKKVGGWGIRGIY